jgi:hypothetical protein
MKYAVEPKQVKKEYETDKECLCSPGVSGVQDSEELGIKVYKAKDPS